MDRDTLLALLGSFEPMDKDRPYTLSPPIDHGLFTVQEVSYKDSDGISITALLLIPSHIDTNTLHPAIIACHQHANQFEIGMEEPAGLAGNGENAFALPLLEAGFVVICPEHIGFGRRRVLYDDHSPMAGREGERWLFIQELLRGRTLLGKSLRDLSCIFEILSHLPFVDSKRIGIAGHSMGGLMSFFFALYEKRIKAVASSCGIAPLALLQERRLNHNFSMYLPNLLNHGDTEDLFSLLSPTPLYLTFGANDPIFPKEGSHLLCERAKEAYEGTGTLITEITEDGHGFTEEKQAKNVEFFRKWL